MTDFWGSINSFKEDVSGMLGEVSNRVQTTNISDLTNDILQSENSNPAVAASNILDSGFMSANAYDIYPNTNSNSNTIAEESAPSSITPVIPGTLSVNEEVVHESATPSETNTDIALSPGAPFLSAETEAQIPLTSDTTTVPVNKNKTGDEKYSILKSKYLKLYKKFKEIKAENDQIQNASEMKVNEMEHDLKIEYEQNIELKNEKIAILVKELNVQHLMIEENDDKYQELNEKYNQQFCISLNYIL